MGATAYTTDLAHYESVIGIPAPLALLHETLYGAMFEWIRVDGRRRAQVVDRATHYPIQWFEMIPLGANLRGVTSRFLQAMLLGLVEDELQAATKSVRHATRMVAAIHGKLAEGASCPPKTWLEARAAMDDASNDAYDQASRLLSQIALQVMHSPDAKPACANKAVTTLIRASEDASWRSAFLLDQRSAWPDSVLQDESPANRPPMQRTPDGGLPGTGDGAAQFRSAKKQADSAASATRLDLAEHLYQTLLNSLPRS